MRERSAEDPIWGDALLAAALFAVAPAQLGGAAIRSLAGPGRDAWLETLRALLPDEAPMRRVPLHASESRILGGLDLTATLRAGRPVAERGILAAADGGVVVLAMAERMELNKAAHLVAALDAGEVVLERDGLALRTPSHFGVVALDEGLSEEERPPAALMDRLAFHIDLSGATLRDLEPSIVTAEEVTVAAARYSAVSLSDDALQALCTTAMALGIGSLRAPLLAARAAKAHAALCGEDSVSEVDLQTAARLVLAPRATMIPQIEDPEDESTEEQPPEPQEPPEEAEQKDESEAKDKPLDDVILEAAQAAIPPGLLAMLKMGLDRHSRGASAGGKAGAQKQSKTRGRPIGTRQGDLRDGMRLNVVETLRAAAPWQPIRRTARGEVLEPGKRPARVEVRRDDFRISRHKERSETATIFVVDASGSAALHRLAEAKGAVELLLADCYVRRDQVALIAFRGREAELLLPPTRSLTRAKRSLAGLPGGGGTPLATAIDAAAALADSVKRKGQTPSIVFLTDGRANIARDGEPGRPQAEEDALASARAFRLAGFRAVLVDTSPRPQPKAEKLAGEMAAIYLPLPYADAEGLSQAVRAVSSNVPAAA
ncbi:magnesium chelatase subunit D [Afifella aestuarii]|uniref:magnesium chelatase subunit D n=1 Tax=Afifella aestuarii TaxID=1909496 RepID=UPI000FE42FCE|nr:magnesium chelatase subunit D [Afifella aestuarii]